MNQYGFETVSSCENWKGRGRAQITFSGSWTVPGFYQMAYHHHLKTFGDTVLEEGEPRSLYELMMNRCAVEVRFHPERLRGTTYGFSRRPGERVLYVPTGKVDEGWEFYIPCDDLPQFWLLLDGVLPSPEKGKKPEEPVEVRYED